jgi:hypothetical protein
VQLNA